MRPPNMRPARVMPTRLRVPDHAAQVNRHLTNEIDEQTDWMYKQIYRGLSFQTVVLLLLTAFYGFLNLIRHR